MRLEFVENPAKEFMSSNSFLLTVVPSLCFLNAFSIRRKCYRTSESSRKLFHLNETKTLPKMDKLSEVTFLIFFHFYATRLGKKITLPARRQGLGLSDGWVWIMKMLEIADGWHLLIKQFIEYPIDDNLNDCCL